MRRLPIYFLIDVSESMVGAPIEQVQDGMRTIIKELHTDPYALETAFVSIIAFAGKTQVLSPLTELYKFYPPILPIGGGTALGKALQTLMNDMETSLQKTTEEQKGDWKPIVFLFTDGTPTDDTTAAFAKWNAQYRKKANLIAISIGDNVNTQLLGEITDNVFRLSETDANSFKSFFKWITASIKATSVSVNDMSDDSVKLAPTTGINIEKVDPSTPCVIDENFAVFWAKCSVTKRNYLIKFAKRNNGAIDEEYFSYQPNKKYKLVGAYPIDEENYNLLSDGKSNRSISTSELQGLPTCPCCGNQLGFVVCQCGNIMCSDFDSNEPCPWCGLEGSLGDIEAGGIDITRERG